MLRSIPPLLALALVASAASAGPPAALARGDAGRERAERSFERFAHRWMEKMERAEAHNRAQARPLRRGREGGWELRYRAYGGTLKTRLRPTGYAPAPYVGVLEYAEQLMVCEASPRGRCRVADSAPVTEIFRYQDGRWVY